MKYFYGYNIVAAGFAIQAVSIGALFTYGVFFKDFQAELGWSRTTISGASSLVFLMAGFAGILAGRLNDRIGPKKLFVGSGIALGIGYMLMSRLQTPWQLYLLYGVLVGAGMSTHDVVTLSTVTRWFVKRRGMMSGILKMGTGAGQLVAPLAATALITAVGWRNAYITIGAATMIAYVVVAQFFRRDPRDIGLLPDGNDPASDRVENDSVKEGVTFKSAVRSREFAVLCAAEFVALSCLFTVVVHIIPHSIDLGLSPAIAAGVLGTIGGVSMLGRFVMGTANDRIGGKRSLMICFSILLCSIIWLQFAVNAWMLFTFAAIIGFTHGGIFTVMSPTVAEMFGTRSHGTLFGIVLCCGMTGGAIGPLLAGSTFDATGSYRTVFLILTALAVFGFLLTLLLRPRPGREAGR